MRVWKVLYGCSILMVCLTAAEVTARVQDRIRWGMSFLATPDWDHDLFIDSRTGRRGRPNGAYKHWKLNAFGFRHGEMREQPAAGTRRVIVLGASESFGLYETPGKEFPAQLGKRLQTSGYEVVNAALTGLTLATTVTYWNEWVSRFDPTLVVVYPSPLFYLRETPPRRPMALRPDIAASPPVSGRPFSAADLRLFGRLQDLIDVPEPIQARRDRRALAAARIGRPPEWLFQAPPRDRVDLFIAHLADLVAAVRMRHTEILVLTHAMRVGPLVREDDERWLRGALVNTPRATEGALIGFEHEVNTSLRDWCKRNGVPVVDVDAEISGRRDLFGDLIHFNDSGASRVADLLARAIQDGSGIKGGVLVKAAQGR